MTLTLFFDGGCRPNPGAMELAVVARGVAYVESDIGEGSNSDAEWLALLHALTVARRLGARDIVAIGDSALVVAQASGVQPCRSAALQRHKDAFDLAARDFDRIRLRAVRRSRNLAGIVLARRRQGL